MIYITATDNCKEIAHILKEWTKKEYNDKYLLQNSYFVVARDDDKTIGCAQLIIIGDPFWNRRWGLIENVYILPQYRNKGIGEKLMKFIETEARQFECEFLKLTSSYDKIDAHKLYKALDYREGFSFKKIIE